jgi:hypothetical protein
VIIMCNVSYCRRFMSAQWPGTLLEPRRPSARILYVRSAKLHGGVIDLVVLTQHTSFSCDVVLRSTVPRNDAVDRVANVARDVVLGLRTGVEGLESCENVDSPAAHTVETAGIGTAV